MLIIIFDILNISDLHRCNIVEDPLCSCGHLEDAYHLFFVCKKYYLEGQSLMLNLLSLNYLYIIDVHLLLWGDESLTVDQNFKIFKAVQNFIHE